MRTTCSVTPTKPVMEASCSWVLQLTIKYLSEIFHHFWLFSLLLPADVLTTVLVPEPNHSTGISLCISQMISSKLYNNTFIAIN